MSFLPSQSPRNIKPDGDLNNSIAIVGDYTSLYDNRNLLPFQGPAGTVLEQCLHVAGLIRSEVYLTNVFKQSVPRTKGTDGEAATLFSERRGVATAAGLPLVAAFQSELSSFTGNVIVACGKAASTILCGVSALGTKRGYVFPSIGLNRTVKVIPTFHPNQSIRGNYTYRHLIICDLKKAVHESKFPEIRRPDRKLIYKFSSVEEAVAWIEYFREQPNKPLSVDIEVINFEVSCINLSVDPSVGVVIPIADRWTLEEELIIWRKLDELLSADTPKVLQNGIFDIQFMLSKYGVSINGEIHDTMIAHSCMYPELPKGLGFLGSIYCGAQEYWKDLIKFNDIKDNS